MTKVHNELTDELLSWIKNQPMYFLGSAPLSAQGHINLSPRGLDSLRVLDPNQVLILDLTGSGNETAAHVMENGRLTIMFCAFEGAPRILRLYGEAEVILADHPDWPSLRAEFPNNIPGIRQIFRLLVTRVQTSCGYGVPLMDFVAQREDLLDWARKKGEPGLAEGSRVLGRLQDHRSLLP